MRLDTITASQRRMLAEVTGRISTLLAAEFEQGTRPESLNVGVTIRERGKSGRLDVPYGLLQDAEENLAAREALRVRIKTVRDRMMFRLPPSRPRADITPLGDPGGRSRGGFVRGGGRGRR